LKSPVLQFSFPCDAVREDSGGAISVDRIIDGYHVRKPDEGNPLSFIQVLIVNGWADGEGVHSDRVAVRSETGDLVAESRDHQYALESPLHRAVNTHGLGLQVGEEGVYQVEIYRDGEQVLAYPIGIRFRAEQRRA
jgi:hypothetical protein